jgi:hypothetical protein
MYRDLIEDLESFLENGRFRRFSNVEANRIGDKIGVDWKEIPLGEFRAGLTVELEHGKHDPETDVTHDDVYKTGRIVLAHLKEDPTYYERLRRAGIRDIPSTK